MYQNPASKVGGRRVSGQSLKRPPSTSDKDFESLHEEEISAAHRTTAKTRRYQSLLVIIGALYLAILATLDFLFIRSSFAESENDPLVFFISFSIATALFIGIGYLAFQNALAVERAAAAEAQAQLRVRLVHMAAHELRNPMASIKVMLALLRRRIQKDEPPQSTIPLTRTIDIEIDRLSSILNGMLEAFEAQEDQILLEAEPVDLVACAKTAMLPFEASAPDHHIHLHVRPDLKSPRGLFVRGDFRRLEDVLRNLLSNAIKFSPGGGEVEVRLFTEGAQAIVAVSDHGVGIPSAQQAHIFDSFFRADNLGDDDPGGMGLGLFICHEIIQKHRGSIQVESRPGKGSTLTVRLPRFPHESGSGSLKPTGAPINDFQARIS